MVMAEGDETKGLYRKYKIQHADGRPVESQATYFVLRVDEFGINDRHTRLHREAARDALITYAGACGNAVLSQELVEMVRAIEAREKALGQE